MYLPYHKSGLLQIVKINAAKWTKVQLFKLFPWVYCLKLLTNFVLLYLFCMPCVVALDVNIHEKQATNKCRRWKDQITKRASYYMYKLQCLWYLKRKQQIAKKKLCSSPYMVSRQSRCLSQAVQASFMERKEKQKWKQLGENNKEKIISNIITSNCRQFGCPIICTDTYSQCYFVH